MRVNEIKNEQHIASLIKIYGPEFPPSPLPGIETIVQIRSHSDLIAEGKEMQHCVAIYAELVYKRQCYIYRVLHPERGTLELIINNKGKPEIANFSLYRNASPSKNSWEKVQEWLANSQCGTCEPISLPILTSNHLILWASSVPRWSPTQC
ncbi:MAG: PcfJ domain-containing protein [SAR324 cluster bacterium]|nr:PcfJ domain-containing protein [SAR324 cluster bacterium]